MLGKIEKKQQQQQQQREKIKRDHKRKLLINFHLFVI